MEMLRKKILLLLLVPVLLLASCRMQETATVVIGVTLEPVREYNFEHEMADWTVMVYMPADNALEKNALEDLNEMEACGFDFENNHVIVLLDCNNIREGYDGEWSGTRLYEITPDKNGMNGDISSLRLGCRELGISARTEGELNTADPDVLRTFVSSTAGYYPAEHYAFVMWGECSGYTGRNRDARALAFDDASISYMGNADFANALAEGLGQKFDVLALDSCFGSEIELLYDFEQCAQYFVGTEELQKDAGWDYRALLDALNQGCGDAESFARFMYQSQNVKNISLVDLSGIRNLADEFDQFAKTLSSSIRSKSDAKKMQDEILKSGFCFSPHELSVNPVYIDIRALSLKYGGTSLAECVTNTAQCADPSFGGMGVFFCSIDKNGDVVQLIPQDYVRNSSGTNCPFVNQSGHYAFSRDKSGTLLDKIFGNCESY